MDLSSLPLDHLRWESIATPAADAGTVVIAGDDDALVTALASAADQVGASTVVLGGDTVPDRVAAMPRDRGEWARFLAESAGRGTRPPRARDGRASPSARRFGGIR